MTFLKDSSLQPSLHKHTSHFWMTPGTRSGPRGELSLGSSSTLGEWEGTCFWLCFCAALGTPTWLGLLGCWLSIGVRTVDGWGAQVRIIGKTDCLSILFSSTCRMTPRPVPSPASVSWCPADQGKEERFCEASPTWGHYLETTDL